MCRPNNPAQNTGSNMKNSIEVTNQAAALEWAGKAPFPNNGAVEVKQHLPNPLMSAKPTP